MNRTLVRWIGLAEALALPLAVVLVIGALRIPGAAEAQTAGGARLLPPETLRASGAALEWTAFDAGAGTFESYELHRGASEGFTPSAATRLATVRDRGVTTFVDTTAAPQTTFTYKLLTNGVASGTETVTLPATGRAVTTLEPSAAEGDSTFLEHPGETSPLCASFGALDSLWVSAEPASVRRTLLRFDLTDVPADAAVSSAELTLRRTTAGASSSLTVDVHAVTRGWTEGTGTGTCTGDGASWEATQANVTWSSAGGDHAGDASSSLTLPEGAEPGRDTFAVTGLVREWVRGERSNVGALLKLRDETASAGRAVTYLSDDASSDRPRLRVEYADGNAAVAPRVEVAAPRETGDVSGASVALKAAANDDGRVARVEFIVDGAVVATDTAAPYETTWDSTSVANGETALAVRATDDAGNTTTSSAVSLDVDNSEPPTVRITSPSTVYREQIRADRPAAYWRFGETAGSTAADASGNGRDAALSGAYALGEAGLLTGDPDRSAMLRDDLLDDGTATAGGLTGLLQDGLTIEAWVDFADLGAVPSEIRVASRGWGSASGWRFAIARRLDGHKLVFDRGFGPHMVETAARVAPGQHHVVVTDTGSTTRLFVDGEQVAQNADRAHAHTTSAPLIVGGALARDALFDEVAVYDEALSPNTVRVHHAVGLAQVPKINDTFMLRADAYDDRAVDRVEFYVDDVLVDTDTAAPYDGRWDTRSADAPAYDGRHEITARAYDGSGQTTTSESRNADAANGDGNKYKAGFSSTEFPRVVRYEPDAPTPETHGIDVTVRNESNRTWSASDVVLRPRWIPYERSAPTVEGDDVPLGADVPPDGSRTARVLVEAPALPDGVTRARYTLRIDLYSTESSELFADRGNKPLEHPVLVEHALEHALGLESWWQYDSEALGASAAHLVNVSNGNSLVRWSPFASIGRGLSTVLDLTYNSLETHSESPVGPGFSLAISTLTRFGNPIDVHPNKADEIAGRSNRFVELTDGDGTTHRFTGRQAADGSVYWEEPPGVHLYLREHSGSDPARKWALTRPDRVTFFYDVDGFPTSVEDANGNRLAFTLEETPPGDDPGGPKKRIVRVTDAAASDMPAPSNRSFDISYYGQGDARKAQVRGKVKRITDHDGSALDFEYYDDGNLLRIVQRGGTSADGSLLADRSFVFTYTTSSGDGPAIPEPADRAEPEPRTSNQSTRLYSVRDPRGAETRFEYYGPGTSHDRWKLKARVDRAGKATSFAYDASARRTTVTAPLSRVTKHDYDTEGKPTRVTNPKNEETGLAWSADRQMMRIEEPGGRITTFAYDDNGQLTDRIDALGHHTRLEYDHPQAGPGDEAGRWRAGRTMAHLSDLRKKTDPNGMRTPALDDFQWEFTYEPDGKGNVDKVIDPEGHETDHDYNADGTLSQITDANGNVTRFEAYDPSGQPARVRDGNGDLTQFAYTADGRLRSVQDGRHASDSGANEREYRAVFDYDAFHRPGLRSEPKSTQHDRGNLIWSASEYDANDNVVATVAPHYGRGYSGAGARTTVAYDTMDRATLITEPDTSADPAGERTRLDYDEAGRVERVTEPRGMKGETDEPTSYVYDPLDRVVRQAEGPRITHYCYDVGGDLVSVSEPKANVATVDCSLPSPPFTTEMGYDLTHRPTSVKDPEGRTRSFGYDANGNVETITDAQGSVERRSYDERNLLVRREEPFNPLSQPILPTEFRYDAVGNLSQLISPRALLTGHTGEPTHYVTRYEYDGANRVKRVLLPFDDTTTQAYVHHAYDAAGNLTAISLPIETADAGSDPDDPLPQVPANQKTRMTHWDPGWIRTSNDPAPNPTVRFDYRSEGWQSLREAAGKQLRWEYYIDGQLKSESGRDDQLASYEYDAEDQLTKAIDRIGSGSAPGREPLELTATYNAFDEVQEVRNGELDETSRRFTTLAYDLNGNLERREDDGRVEADGTRKAGRVHAFAHDRADWPIEHLDGNEDASPTDDRRITTAYWPTGWEQRQTIEKHAPEGGWRIVRRTETTYTLNGLVSRRETRGRNARAMIESHRLVYGPSSSGGANVTLENTWRPGVLGRCRYNCRIERSYDARDHLIREHHQPNGEATYEVDLRYELDVAGNVRRQTALVGSGAVESSWYPPVTSDYSGNQLTRRTVGSDDEYYQYNAFGEVDCVTLQPLSRCPEPTGGGMWHDYSYDALGRFVGSRSWDKEGNETLDSTYSYDPLDRPVHQIARKGGGPRRSSLFHYLALTQLLASEELREGAGESGDVLRRRSYRYDDVGRRTGLTVDRPGTPTAHYLYTDDGRESVMAIFDEDASPEDVEQATEQYGYGAYGQRLIGFTREKLDSALEPFAETNPYRFQGKREDGPSGTLDMGARRFSAATGRFLQQDAYDGALSNLSLATDPLTQNRYALAGGNPVGFIEVDGHINTDATDGYGTSAQERTTRRRKTSRRSSARGSGSGSPGGRGRAPITDSQMGYQPGGGHGMGRRTAAGLDWLRSRQSSSSPLEEFGRGLGDAASELAETAKRPHKIPGALVHSVTHPGDTVSAIADSCDGRTWASCAGYAAGSVAGGKGLGAAGRAVPDGRGGPTGSSPSRASRSGLARASEAAARAAEGPIRIPLKHLPGAGGNYSKFAEGTDPRSVVREALRSQNAVFRPNPGGGYRVDTDLQEVVGEGGRTTIRSIVSPDGRLITAYPYGPRRRP